MCYTFVGIISKSIGVSSHTAHTPRHAHISNFCERARESVNIHSFAEMSMPFGYTNRQCTLYHCETVVQFCCVPLHVFVQYYYYYCDLIFSVMGIFFSGKRAFVREFHTQYIQNAHTHRIKYFMRLWPTYTNHTITRDCRLISLPSHIELRVRGAHIWPSAIDEKWKKRTEKEKKNYYYWMNRFYFLNFFSLWPCWYSVTEIVTWHQIYVLAFLHFLTVNLMSSCNNYCLLQYICVFFSLYSFAKLSIVRLNWMIWLPGGDRQECACQKKYINA